MKPHQQPVRTFPGWIAMVLLIPVLAAAQEPAGTNPAARPGVVRFATYNISFHRQAAGELAAELSREPEAAKPRQIAEVIQRVRPHVVLLNEFDYDSGGKAIAAFQEQFLEVGQGGQEPIRFPYRYCAPVNTGMDSGIDLDGNGKIGGPNDCYGFGRYPGQYGMVVLSQFPIEATQVRTFQKFLWRDMPDHQMPLRPGTAEPYYSAEAREVFRLSSKSHWDVPIQVGDQRIHFLVSHPTPPVFDGPEDRNGRRNHDEIRLWADYVDPQRSGYLTDDRGQAGGLPAGARFVIAGDLNADPQDGDSLRQAARQLTEHPLIDDRRPPRSTGGKQATEDQGGRNTEHRGDPAEDTGDFFDQTVGNLRLDYCLPSRTLRPVGGGVFWPRPGEPGAESIQATDHRMVWLDLKLDD